MCTSVLNSLQLFARMMGQMCLLETGQYLVPELSYSEVRSGPRGPAFQQAEACLGQTLLSVLHITVCEDLGPLFVGEGKSWGKELDLV